MRYAVLSDVHANLEALTAVLDDLAGQRIDRTLALGDLIGYGADPEACLSLLRERQVAGVAGNHEWAAIGKLDARWFNDSARRAVLWTRDRLSFGDLDYLRRLPLALKDGPLTLVHATLHHPEQFHYLVDMAQAVDAAAHCETACCLIGHTHLALLMEYDLRQQRMTRVLTGASELAEARLDLDASHMRYIINPGSVGQPRDGDPRASCAVIDTAAGTCAIRRVPYDISSAQQKIVRAGLPQFLADRLAVGR